MFSKRYDQQLSAFDFQNEFSKLYPDYIYFKHIKTFFIWLPEFHSKQWQKLGYSAKNVTP